MIIKGILYVPSSDGSLVGFNVIVETDILIDGAGILFSLSFEEVIFSMIGLVSSVVGSV
jgi:hypothetical protein